MSQGLLRHVGHAVRFAQAPAADLPRGHIERLLAPADLSAQGSVEFLGNQLRDARGRLERAQAGLSGYRSAHAQELAAQRGTMLARLSTLRDGLSEHHIQLAGAEGELAALRSRLLRTDPVIFRLEQQIVDATSDLADCSIPSIVGRQRTPVTDWGRELQP